MARDEKAFESEWKSLAKQLGDVFSDDLNAKVEKQEEKVTLKKVRGLDEDTMAN